MYNAVSPAPPTATQKRAACDGFRSAKARACVRIASLEWNPLNETASPKIVTPGTASPLIARTPTSIAPPVTGIFRSSPPSFVTSCTW